MMGDDDPMTTDRHGPPGAGQPGYAMHQAGQAKIQDASVRAEIRRLYDDPEMTPLKMIDALGFTDVTEHDRALLASLDADAVRIIRDTTLRAIDETKHGAIELPVDCQIKDPKLVQRLRISERNGRFRVEPG